VKELEIYIHSLHGDDPKLIKIDEEKTVEELIKKIQIELNLPSENEFFILIEDEEIVLERHKKLSECGIATLVAVFMLWSLITGCRRRINSLLQRK